VDNTASNNEIEGIYLILSNENSLIGNDLTNNGHWPYPWEEEDAGITLVSSSNNNIYYNNLIDNIIQAQDNRNDNYWHNGYPSGGNYWSDYWGEDLYYGPNQDIPGSDGIGDTPHRFDPNSYDRYPLINQVNPPTGPNSPPVANAGTDLNIFLGETAQLDGSNSYDPEGDALNCYWDFGDSSQYSQSVSPTCNYKKTGVYNATLTVWDVYRNVDSDTCKITVVEVPNFPPVVNTNIHFTLNEGENITFHANASDANGDPLTYDWDFGDGNISSLVNTSHIYQDNGLYNVTLTVTDDSGASAISHILVNVLNVCPVVSLGPDLTLSEGDTVLLAASATDASPVDTLSYYWDLNNDGIYDDAIGETVNWSWYDDGQFNVSVNVSDDDGGSGYAFITVTVNNVAPAVSLSISSSIIDKGEPVILYVNYSDPGADSYTFLWDYGDGSYSYEPIPNHTYTMDGDYTIIFTVMDDDGGTGIDHLNVTVVNTPPIIEEIYVTVEITEEEISSNCNNITEDTISHGSEPNNPNSSVDLMVIHDTNDKNPDEQKTETSPILESQEIYDENDSPALDRIVPQSIYTGQRCFLFAKANDPDEDELLTFSDDSELVEIDPYFGVITFIPKEEDVGYHFVNVTVTDTHGEEDTRLMVIKIEEPPTYIRESKKDDSFFPMPLLLIPVIVLFIVIILMHDFMTRKRVKAKEKKTQKPTPMKVKKHPKKQPRPIHIPRTVPPPSYSVMYASDSSKTIHMLNINNELDVIIEYPLEVFK
jgi:parallel beta-helix repeat protein